MIKKLTLLMAVSCLLLAGCGKEKETAEIAQSETSETTEESVLTVKALPDTTMENLTDATLAVSLEEGDVYIDDTGVLQMDVEIHTYNKYDMVDISMLKEGDVIEVHPGCIDAHSGEIKIDTLERNDRGRVIINGDLEEGGFHLDTDDDGVYHEEGFDNVKNWYEVGEATLRVSTDFKFYDNSDWDAGEQIFYPGSFLNGEVTDYDFHPHYTTIRVEDGQVVEMNRRFQP